MGRIPPSLIEYAEGVVDKIIDFIYSFDRQDEWANRAVMAAGVGNGFGEGFTILKEYISDMMNYMNLDVLLMLVLKRVCLA